MFSRARLFDGWFRLCTIVCGCLRLFCAGNDLLTFTVVVGHSVCRSYFNCAVVMSFVVVLVASIISVAFTYDCFCLVDMVLATFKYFSLSEFLFMHVRLPPAMLVVVR